MENVNRVNVFVYSDSTAMSRPGHATIGESWPFKLMRILPNNETTPINLVTRYMPAAASKRLIGVFRRDAHNFGFLSGTNQRNIVIFAFGINDAAPRPLTYPLRHMTKIRWLGPRIWALIEPVLNRNKPLIMRFGSYKATSFRVFKNLHSKVFSNSPGVTAFIMVKTPIPHPFLELRTKGYSASVEKLNNLKMLLAEQHSNIKIVDVSEFKNDDYVSKEDGHHFTISGHAYIATEIAKVLIELVLK
ncbi:unannotated protein [freshwater metagenome]|uniref:Unannotated protein n=1 Tax=freshwater metagenome TaxID=449393 RepID=A0A6J7WB19_9ZZZZ